MSLHKNGSRWHLTPPLTEADRQALAAYMRTPGVTLSIALSDSPLGTPPMPAVRARRALSAAGEQQIDSLLAHRAAIQARELNELSTQTNVKEQ